MGSYIPTTRREEEEMLAAIGLNSLDELFSDIPASVREKADCGLPEGRSELEVRRLMEEMADANTLYRTVFRGAGAYRHYIPEIVKSVTGKEEFLTAYTPYQAEISQGVLQSIFEYQTMVCRLTGMDSANASVYDGPTAAAEAAAMCRDRRRNRFFLSAAAHPDIIEVMRTYAFGNGMELVLVPEKDGVTDAGFLQDQLGPETAGLLVQSPNYYGILEDATALGELVHAVGGKFVMSVNPTSLGILQTPAEQGADIAVGDGQPLGMPLSFGGPYLGFMACKSDLTRKLPGRIVGETTDGEGRRGYVLTLQAREQHIRREKASSNVCSNEALCAMTAAVYLAAMGPDGLRQAALQSASKAAYMQKELEKLGFGLVYEKPFFHEFVTNSPVPAEQVERLLSENGILGGLPLDGNRILWCCTELNTKEEIDRVAGLLKGGLFA